MSNENKDPNQDLIAEHITVGKWQIPPLTVHTAILLERIDSPFVRAVPIDPATGQPVQVQPSMEEVARSLFVLLNHRRPDITTVISDPEVLDREVTHLAQQITFQELQTISSGIEQAVTAPGEAMGDTELETTEKKG